MRASMRASMRTGGLAAALAAARGDLPLGTPPSAPGMSALRASVRQLNGLVQAKVWVEASSMWLGCTSGYMVASILVPLNAPLLTHRAPDCSSSHSSCPSLLLFSLLRIACYYMLSRVIKKCIWSAVCRAHPHACMPHTMPCDDEDCVAVWRGSGTRAVDVQHVHGRRVQ